MKPKSLLLVLILGWIAVAVAGVVALIGLIGILRASTYYNGGAVGMAWVFWVLQLAAIGALATGQFLVTQRRLDLGRWLFVGGAGGYLLLQIIGMALSYGGSAVDILLFIIALGLMVATAVFLFMPDMNAWLGKPGLSNMMSGYGQQPQQQPIGHDPQPTGWGAQPTQFPPQPGQDYSQPVGHSQPSGHSQPIVQSQPMGRPQPFQSDFTQPTGYPPVPSQSDVSQPIGAAGPFAPAAHEAPSDPVPPPTGAMRTCPYCAEQIRAEAVKCRYCGSEVTPTAPSA